MEKMIITDSIITFIGLGLISGSIAHTIRKTRPDTCIVAYMRPRSRLEQTRGERIVGVISDGIDENLRKYDLIFLYTPVEYNAGYLSAIRPYLRQGALITDVGSTKYDIHEEIRHRGLEYCFVGSHPMAGSEETGYENSMNHLLENAYYIVTPLEGENNPRPQVLSLNAEHTVAVVKTIGVIPLVLNYRERDKVVTAIGHLPYLVASSLVNLIKDHDTTDGTMKQVTAGGFKDITRIASSSPEMWEQICMISVAPMSDILGACIVSLNKMLEEIKEHKGQDIYRLLEISRDCRNPIIDKAKGSVEPSHEFAVDVSSEVGAISTVSAILATESISVKNIDISNNRERGGGALKITFYDEAPMEAAWQGLDKCEYGMSRM